MGPIQYAILVLLVLGLLLTITFILMHAGKGSGLSDAATSHVAGTKIAASVMERNLNILTNIAIVMFIASLILCLFFFPQGTAGV